MQALLTKATVARHQLATAIDLYFSEGDVISVYSLSANAWEVIDVLCTKAGVESMSIQARENVPAGKDLKRDYINSPHRNFFKHANCDPEACLEPLSVAHVESLIFLAVEDYIRLYNRSPIQFQAFQAWYLAKYPDRLEATIGTDLMERLQVAFPSLQTLSYQKQLEQGRRVIAESCNDQELLEDARTEAAFNINLNRPGFLEGTLG